MSAQNLLKSDLWHIEEQSQGQTDSCAKPPNTDPIFMGKLPKVQLLSYPPNTEVYEESTQEMINRNERNMLPIVWLKAAPHQDFSISLQKWEGVVTQVMKDSFLARLFDLTQKGPDEEAEFPLQEISKEDIALIKPGAVFYWNIGYHDSRTGQRIRASMIRFRRLPAWSEKELETAKHEAERIRDWINWK